MEQMAENIFGNRLKLARKMAGFSLQELADALENKVTKQSLNKYEMGLMNPSGDVLVAISSTLKVKPDSIQNYTDILYGKNRDYLDFCIAKIDQYKIFELILNLLL